MAFFPVQDVERLILALLDPLSLTALARTNRYCYRVISQMSLYRDLKTLHQNTSESGSRFLQACRLGSLPLAQYFYRNRGELHGFRLACLSGHLEVAQWLLQDQRVRVFYQDHPDFISQVCTEEQLTIFQWLIREVILPDLYPATLLALFQLNQLGLVTWLFEYMQSR